MVVLSLNQIRVELMIKFNEDFWKKVFNGKSSRTDNYGLFVPFTSTDILCFRFATRLVPTLRAVPECTIIPQQVCNFKFSPPKTEKKPMRLNFGFLF